MTLKLHEGEYQMATKQNLTTLDAFLEEEGIRDVVEANALKRVLALELEDAMRQANITKSQMAKRMETSRAQLDRFLNFTSAGLTLETMVKAANAVGKRLDVRLL
jgi:antitoxin HicB